MVPRVVGSSPIFHPFESTLVSSVLFCYMPLDVDFILHGGREMEKIKKEENRYVFFLLIVAEA